MNQILRMFSSYWWLLSLSFLVVTTVASLYPADSLPTVPGTDKTHHLIAYAAVAFPVALARPACWLSYIVGIVAYSGAIELIQPYVNRYGEWYDLGANSLGVLTGILLAYVLRWLVFRSSENTH
ncbi:VanZ family protein [Thalassolituus sp.]|uniref:VanZ family protein n=1 Tax=Thalassolituus sp. TaxID=2030822 RepID=UPI003512F3A9